MLFWLRQPDAPTRRFDNCMDDSQMTICWNQKKTGRISQSYKPSRVMHLKDVNF